MSSSDRAHDVLERELRFLKGVGPRRAEMLARLGLHTVRDLIFHLPRSYEDRRSVTRIRDLKNGQKGVISGTVLSVDMRPTRRGAGILEVAVTDGSGVLGLTWFNARHSWAKSFPQGARIMAYGQMAHYGGPQMVAPDYVVDEDAGTSERFGRILPVYPLTEGISQAVLRKLTRAALETGASKVAEILPEGFLARKDFPSAYEALWQVHFPDDAQAAERARRRLSYEELFVFQAAFAIRRVKVQQTPGIAFRAGPNVDRRIRKLFPFELTGAQDRVIAELVSDMRAEHPMNRLLQGEVGCGKTVVALYAMLAALAESSKAYQVALMAPTEVLAEQHYLTLRSLLQKARVRTARLSGAATSAERAEALGRIAAGDVDLVVGTHALIQRGVHFKNLALVVIDEQHRFGVRQRFALRRKGARPDTLIMTATPIPRTLALACFGDMDISVIDEMPPGRQSGETVLLPPGQWSTAFEAALEELRRGKRVFVVYPLVEGSQELDLTSATEGYEELRGGVFREFDCCLMHGQMRSAMKQRAMEGFRDGRYRVMVATTVIEVGIDVPEATVMIIQHAERLGLAQLHQLRGRIGRGQAPGRCFLLAEPTTDEARQRLEVLTQTTDGFKIAEADLRIRGPGQLFGTEQSGIPEFRCYDFSDLKLLEQARRDAFALVGGDPDLSRPEHALLREAIRRGYGKGLVLGGVG